MTNTTTAAFPSFLWEEDSIDSRLQHFMTLQEVSQLDSSTVPTDMLLQLFGEEARSYASSLFSVERFSSEEWLKLTDQVNGRVMIRAMDPAFSKTRRYLSRKLHLTTWQVDHGEYAEDMLAELDQNYPTLFSLHDAVLVAAMMEKMHYSTIFLFQESPKPGQEELHASCQIFARYYMWMLDMFTTYGRIPNTFFEAERQDSLNMTDLYQQTKAKAWGKLPPKPGDW